MPVATVAINNSTNAALLAIRMLGAFIPGVLEKMDDYMKKMETEVMRKVDKLDTVVSYLSSAFDPHSNLDVSRVGRNTKPLSQLYFVFFHFFIITIKSIPFVRVTLECTVLVNYLCNHIK